MRKSYVVNFIISDTYAEHLPDRRKDNGKVLPLGTEYAHKCSTLKEAIRLANGLIHLTTGRRDNTVFKREQFGAGVKRMSWSHANRTHHCEILLDGNWTGYTTATKKGTPE